MGLPATVLPTGGGSGGGGVRGRTSGENRRHRSGDSSVRRRRARPGRQRPVVHVRVPSAGPDHRRLQEPGGDPARRRGERQIQPDRARRHPEDRRLHGRPDERIQRVRTKIGNSAASRVRAVGVHGRRRNYQGGRR